MQKAVYYMVTGVILLSFALVMNSGDYLKKPTSDKDNVSLYINNIETNILEDNWSGAEQNYENLKKAWDIVVKKIQFSVEKDEINFIEVNLARLGAYLKVEDEDGALGELYEIEEHWNTLND